MQFVIDNSILAKFPEVKIGVLVAKNIDNSGSDAKLTSELRSVEEDVRSKLDVQTLVDNSKISDWRKAYSAFGSKPKTYKNSVEALIRRVLKGDELPDINKIVNIYNLISLKHILPAGGDDIDKVDGDVTLTIAKGGENFTLLGSLQEEVADEGEVIYQDNKEVLCRRWNWRECDKTKMTVETKNVCIVLEALESTTKEELSVALEELKEKVETFCKGETETFFLDKEKNKINF
ncbi:hypothetical protein H8D36_05615 [archaeon]|nr:hypothetical protein [archaeon]MBL7056916.1 hypothetical protein [Candidatus Woesearchaeota archaeon]